MQQNYILLPVIKKIRECFVFTCELKERSKYLMFCQEALNTDNKK